MSGLKAIKQKRISINKTRQVTRAMEAVSAVKMRNAQERALGGRPYAVSALRILSQLSETTDMTGHFMVEHRTTGAYGIIVVTSDKGLAGSLNSAVLKTVEAFLKSQKYDDGEKVAVSIGRRGNEFLKKRSVDILEYRDNRSDSVAEADMRAITDVVIAAHKAKQTRAWYIVYTNFKSTFEQEAIIRRLLPLSRGALQEVVDSIVPETGLYSDIGQAGTEPSSYTVEPNREAVLEAVIPAFANIVVYHALLEAKASEHSARMVAMKSATDKAGELSHALLLKFNKARQAAITREVSEITSGLEAMK
jgi:F-type H+-transporting ATPase subunit gamma